jgi:hypothetical protein
MSRRTIFDAFNEEFERNLSNVRHYQQAYLRAEEVFEQKIGCTLYNNYESFRTVRSKRLKKRD